MSRKIKYLMMLLALLSGLTMFKRSGFTQELMFSLPWFTSDSGGGRSSGGNLELVGTAGQPDAGVLSGGDFSLNGGFWYKAVETEPAGDLAIAQTVTPTIAEPGQLVTYTLTYRNEGTAVATGIVITFQKPEPIANTEFESTDPSFSIMQDVDYVMNVADLKPGEEGTIIVTGFVAPTIEAEMSLVSTAVISADVDSFTGNNQAEATLLVQVPQFEIYLPVIIK